jgi:hypothetical protein
MRRVTRYLDNLAAPALLAAAAFLCLGFAAVWFGGLNQDEGWYLYAAQMVRAGHAPYRDFFYTQGPAMPFVYSALAPIWGRGSPLQGILGGRMVTLVLGLLGTGCAVALARRLVPPARRSAVSLVVFAFLACNLYHLYFNTIPKTYALGGLFLMAGLLLVVRGLETLGAKGGACLFAGGLSLAFATGTRISLLLIMPVVGVVLLARFRSFGWSFAWYGFGGGTGLLLTYGVFALDADSLRGLLAAQSYHAARGGFDPFFVIGSVSRLLRGYLALGVAALAAACLVARGGASCGEALADDRGRAAARAMCWILGMGFLTVFALQLSAPFPYDDYQVPIMGMLAVLVAAWLVGSLPEEAAWRVRTAWFVVLVAAAASFASPLLQEWATYSNDRFWSQKKESTELAKLRAVGRRIEQLDPGGDTLLTQDVYLAVETGRTVPRGLEMGPFCYFADLPDEDARALHVMNRSLMEKLLDSAPCPVAACSGYAFAITAPSCRETPFEEQTNAFTVLKRRYRREESVCNFGQNSTTLLLFSRRASPPQGE